MSNIIVPVAMTDAILTASSVAEDDHDEWAVLTTYGEGAECISATSHRIYESLIGSNTGNDPVADTGLNWLDIGPTNRWAAFDGFEDTPTIANASITYEFLADDIAHSVAFLALAAATVRVRVHDGSDVLIFDEEKRGVSGSNVGGWFDYFIEPVLTANQVIFTDVPIRSGYKVLVDIEGESAISIGLICYGRDSSLGKTLVGTRVGYRDFSRKDYDDFGVRRDLTQRRFVRTVDFDVASASGAVGRVMTLLSDNRATGAVYYAAADLDQYNTTIFGIPDDPDIPIGANVSIYTISIKGNG